MPSSTASKRRYALFAVIRDHPGLTIPELAPKFHEALSTRVRADGHPLLSVDGTIRVRSILEQLLERGDVEYTGVAEPDHCAPWATRRWYVSPTRFRAGNDDAV